MNPNEIKTELVANACEEQRKRGDMPTVVNNEKYITGILETFDNKKAAAKPAPIRNPQKKPGALDKEYERRAKRLGYEPVKGFEFTSKPLASGGPMLQHTRRTARLKALGHRIKLIASDPEWMMARLAAYGLGKGNMINPLALQGSVRGTPPEIKRKREEAAQLWRRLVDDSCVTWGDWDKPQGRKLASYAGQVNRG